MSEIDVAPELQVPGGWKVARQFVHDRVVRSPGERAPSGLLMPEIERLARGGYLKPLTGFDNPFPARQAGAPQTAKEFMKSRDAQVLLNIRRFRPRAPVVREMLRIGEREGRAQVFLEALRLHLDLPVTK